MLITIVIATLCQLSASYPSGMPSQATFVRWDLFTGDGVVGDTRFVYELLVNPKRPGLYEITRYRTFKIASGTGVNNVPNGNEILIWNVQTRPKKPLLCYELVDDDGSHQHMPNAWRAIPHGSDQYRHEMMNAIQVYMLHRANLGLESR